MTDHDPSLDESGPGPDGSLEAPAPDFGLGADVGTGTEAGPEEGTLEEVDPEGEAPVAVTHLLGTTAVFSIAAVVAALADEAGVAPVPSDPGEPLRWLPVAGDTSGYVPVDFFVHLPAGALMPADCMIRVGSLPLGVGVEIVVRPDDHAAAEQAVADLIERARGEGSPLRGRVLQAVGGEDLYLAAFEPPPVDRAALVLDPTIAEATDEIIVPMLRLPGPATSAVLVSGPPGVGKTALCWSIAAEVADDGVTVLSCGPPSPQGPSFTDVYRAASSLAPSLVIIENLDLRCGPRGTDDGRALGDLLAGFDALQRAKAPVVTLATVVDPAAIDGPLRSSAHFDLCLELALPAVEARSEILARLVGDPSVDVRPAANATEGASGADLVTIVRHASLAAARTGDGGLTTAALLHAARRQRPAGDSGLYL